MQIKLVISSHSHTDLSTVLLTPLPLPLQRSQEQRKGRAPPPSPFGAGESFNLSLQLHLSSLFFCLLNLWINDCFLWLTRHTLHDVSGPQVYERKGARASVIPPRSLSQGWLMVLTVLLSRYGQDFFLQASLTGWLQGHHGEEQNRIQPQGTEKPFLNSPPIWGLSMTRHNGISLTLQDCCCIK